MGQVHKSQYKNYVSTLIVRLNGIWSLPAKKGSYLTSPGNFPAV